jgi:hypothetical protein
MKLSFEKTEIVADDAENEKTDSKADELEKDKVVLQKDNFRWPLYRFVLPNFFLASLTPSLLSVQYAITTPPPEN